MRKIDAQEQKILRALTRNPRHSDNRISAMTGVPVRTVNRKRARLEEEGILSYYTVVERQAKSDSGAVRVWARAGTGSGRWSRSRPLRTG